MAKIERTWNDVAIDGDRVLIVGSEGSVILSDDRGASWTRLKTGIKSELRCVASAAGRSVAADSEKTVLVREGDGDWTVLDGLGADHRAAAAKDGWLLLGDGMGKLHLATRGVAFSSVQVFRCVEAIVTDGDSFLVADLLNGVWRWTPQQIVRLPTRAKYPRGLAARDGRIAVAAGKGIVELSTDGGATFRSTSTGAAGALNGVWLGAGGRIVACGADGALACSEDDGASWTLQQLPRKPWLRTVDGYPDGRVWVLGGGKPWWLSDDGGATFTKQQDFEVAAAPRTRAKPADAPGGRVFSRCASAPSLDGIKGLHLAAPGHVVLVGNKGRIAGSEDGGKTWAEQPFGIPDGEAFFQPWLRDAWGSPGALVAVGQHGAVHSSDGGRSWTPGKRAKGKWLTRVHGSSATRRFALLEGGWLWRASTKPSGWDVVKLGRYSRVLRGLWVGEGRVLVCGTKGEIHLSTDEGDTWRQVHGEALLDLNGLWGAGATVFAVGGRAALGGRVLRSEDGGETWETVELPGDTGILHDIGGSSLDDLWVCGAGGSLLHARDGGRSWGRAHLENAGDLRRMAGSGDELWILGAGLWRSTGKAP